MVSMGHLRGESLMIHTAHCTFSAAPRSKMEDLNLVLWVDGEASIVQATGEGGGAVGWVIRKENEDETDSVVRAA